ncbi:hypothetical protein VB735_26005 [Halotia wernerae UHCC 0503]|nr:hypothetical protein [Halotia wernerae UHCC 0503]
MRKQVFYILFVLSLVGILGFSYISEQAPVTRCRSWGFISSTSGKYYSTPEKIVIKPWFGRHRVYGIFMIPNGYRSDHFVTLTIPGEKTYCGELMNAGNNFIEGIYAQPGYYLIKGQFNTRIAVWLIAQGKRNQLQQPSNWRLGYALKKQK